MINLKTIKYYTNLLLFVLLSQNFIFSGTQNDYNLIIVRSTEFDEIGKALEQIAIEAHSAAGLIKIGMNTGDLKITETRPFQANSPRDYKLDPAKKFTIFCLGENPLVFGPIKFPGFDIIMQKLDKIDETKSKAFMRHFGAIKLELAKCLGKAIRENPRIRILEQEDIPYLPLQDAHTATEPEEECDCRPQSRIVGSKSILMLLKAELSKNLLESKTAEKICFCIDLEKILFKNALHLLLILGLTPSQAISIALEDYGIELRNYFPERSEKLFPIKYESCLDDLDIFNCSFVAYKSLSREGVVFRAQIAGLQPNILEIIHNQLRKGGYPAGSDFFEFAFETKSFYAEKSSCTAHGNLEALAESIMASMNRLKDKNPQITPLLLLLEFEMSPKNYSKDLECLKYLGDDVLKTNMPSQRNFMILNHLVVNRLAKQYSSPEITMDRIINGSWSI